MSFVFVQGTPYLSLVFSICLVDGGDGDVMVIVHVVCCGKTRKRNALCHVVC